MRTFVTVLILVVVALSLAGFAGLAAKDDEKSAKAQFAKIEVAGFELSPLEAQYAAPYLAPAANKAEAPDFELSPLEAQYAAPYLNRANADNVEARNFELSPLQAQYAAPYIK
jgi:hypothetical protein